MDLVVQNGGELVEPNFDSMFSFVRVIYLKVHAVEQTVSYAFVLMQREWTILNF